MSDLGVLTSAYTKWNEYLVDLNIWLLSVRKMKDGLTPTDTDITIPDKVRIILRDLSEAFNPDSQKLTSKVPPDIRKKLSNRLEDRTDIFSERLKRLLNQSPLTPDDFSDEDIEMLRYTVTSLDDEVASIYRRIYRH